MPAARRFPVFALAALAFAASLFALAAPAAAQGQFDRPKYASIVVDANSGEVLYALRADQSRYPASITKVMTLYLTFEALATGRLNLDDRVPFSAHAAAQAPTKLGVPAGADISVNEAIQAAAVMSANDAAVALAERVGGNEGHFAQLMSLRAQELGMSNTRFFNANGLPDPRQITTARDIAILSRAVMRDYPQYYAYFNQRSITWRGRTVLNHNRLLLRMAGMDGLKTGYTNAAGFNLAASAVRDGRRLITVVLGGSSTAARDENVESLLTAGFDVLNRRAHGQAITLASALNEPDDNGNAVVRPSYEMGSADQEGLRIVAGQPVPNPPEAAPAMRLARADSIQPRLLPMALRASVRSERECRMVTVRGRHGRKVKERQCRTVIEREAPAAAVVADCRRLKGQKARACHARNSQMARAEAPAREGGSDCHGLKGRRLKSCRAGAHAETAVALRGCAPAPPVDADVATADPSPAKAEAGGGWQVQVGAFTSRARSPRRRPGAHRQGARRAVRAPPPSTWRAPASAATAQTLRRPV